MSADLHQRVSYLPDIHRLLPQAADAERGVLSSFLLAPREIGGLCSERGIKAEHFHMPAHATIFGLLAELHDDNQPIDFIILTQILRDRGQLDQCGGAAYIAELQTFPTAANAGYYIGILEEKRVLREMIKVGTEYAARSYDEQGEVPELLDGFEQAVMGIRTSDDSELREVSPKHGTLEALAKIEKYYENRGKINGAATGFVELDRMTDGLQPAEMIVIAARPSMGKTALAMNIAEHIAVDQGKPVAFFSAEMSSEQLHQRLLCCRARVNLHRMREGFLKDNDFHKLAAAAGKIAESKLLVVDAVGASIGAVRAKARRMHRKHGLAAVFVDYLQLLRSKSAQAAKNREREISEISQGLKNLAKELNIPVVVLAQLNRNPEARGGKGGEGKGRPMLSDLRESGSIEQDADIVGLLVREEYYAVTEDAKAALEGQATLIIAKQRNGPVGDVRLTFLKEFTRFENRAHDAAPETRDYQQ